ncbi:MAG: NFACT family protein [Hydrogenimonas sp.]|nr:NFACT family protein [Hydrogenimonas sp.]
MKYYELESIARYLGGFKRIRSIFRVADNVLRAEFERGIAVGFDLSRGKSEIFDAAAESSLRSYHAPFDSVLKKRFFGAMVEDISTVGHDKVLEIKAVQQGAYKATVTILRLEFTGRHTNAIILDEEGVVVEALRHIDSDSSYRVVKPGVKLKPLPPLKSEPQKGVVEDVEEYLKSRGKKRRFERLADMKRRHERDLLKKIERLKKELDSLPQREALQKRAQRLESYGAIVLANLNRIKPYDTRLEAIDFKGEPVIIELPSLPNSKRAGEHFYSLAKRAASKARNLHIEEENLKSRISFYEKLLENLKSANSEEQISLLFPPKQRHRKREQKVQCEVFQVGEYRVLVGRNERENVWVLKNARAGDMWLHLKDIPSSHCIIQSGSKKELPRDLIYKAAKICVETSVTQPGDYLVDFTHRRNVKIERGAHVTYTNYDTIKVRKD